MCGIVGYVGERKASQLVVSALRRLEYRGYDSAGLAGIRMNGNGKAKGFEVRRCEGSIDELEDLLSKKPLEASTVVGHTRWATHGRPSEKNAHPHRYKDVVVVHNGIIENYKELKSELVKKKHRFDSETDSEVIAHLLHQEISHTGDFEKSCQNLVKRLEGAFALALLWDGEPQKIFVAKQHSPLLLGVGEGENFIASDIPALLEYTRHFLILNDGEMGFVEPSGIRLMDFNGKPLKRKSKTINWSLAMAEKEGFDHFMLKEIHEQPRVVQDTLRGRIASNFKDVHFDTLSWKPSVWSSLRSVSIMACGSAWHAGLLGKYWFEQMAKIHCDVDLASEYRYRDPVEFSRGLGLAISQSGETVDTLAALDEAKRKKLRLAAITNTVDSSVVRKAKNVVYTHAGPEISVASTKCFTAQLLILALMATKLALVKKTKPVSWVESFLKDLSGIGRKMEDVLELEPQIKKVATKYNQFNQYFYLGRGISFPLALEGALKLKEIAYINTQAYSAGEMKHGPIALISKDWPVVCIAPNDSIFKKMFSNMEAVKARGGRLLVIGTKGHQEAQKIADEFIGVPPVREELTPFLTNTVLQIFAYHMAVLRGNNVDKPKNLAKSVTVE